MAAGDQRTVNAFPPSTSRAGPIECRRPLRPAPSGGALATLPRFLPPLAIPAVPLGVPPATRSSREGRVGAGATRNRRESPAAEGRTFQDGVESTRLSSASATLKGETVVQSSDVCRRPPTATFASVLQQALQPFASQISAIRADQTT